jgi:DNA-binding transcriptional LysR family regulator
MPGKIDWENQIGRRLRFRDLHVFFTVVRLGSMAKAAADLGVAPPTVSEVIADLERALGVRLLERGPKGAEPTLYGRALLKRGTAAFEELRQGIRDIEFLSDPAVGEVHIGCDESIAAATLPSIVARFAQDFPGVSLNVEDIDLRTYPPNVRELGFDVVLTRSQGPGEDSDPFNDLNVDVLFEDRLVVVAGANSHWARRRKLDIADLVDEPWILSGPGRWNYRVVAEAFRARGSVMPKVRLNTLSVHLRANLLTSGDFITTFPESVAGFYARRFGLKVLPVALPRHPWPVVALTLKHRTLSPVVTAFLECARAVAASHFGGLSSRNGPLRPFTSL